MSRSQPVPAGHRRAAASDMQHGRAELLRWTARIGAVTADSLALLQDISVASASARLVAASRAKLLARHHLLIGQPAIYTATAAGVRFSGVEGLEPVRISVANAPHTLACAHVAAALQRRYPDHLVSSERELRRDERRAGAPSPAPCSLARPASARSSIAPTSCFGRRGDKARTDRRRGRAGSEGPAPAEPRFAGRGRALVRSRESSTWPHRRPSAQ